MSPRANSTKLLPYEQWFTEGAAARRPRSVLESGCARAVAVAFCVRGERATL
ncbi:hypothetical protein GT030_19785 [Streptomyces sp. SID1328]|uniref:hypothetical protein n=1 Tax=Streptomyces sp. SID1328 TaxID=2690250 RepID=UPI001368B969|nr:hypothetical protein [Streptomyces sp. SID1328]MYV41050.1 hypothetical protein [Streptomyces sp. SID1328]